jgi:hypothetical protein
MVEVNEQIMNCEVEDDNRRIFQINRNEQFFFKIL